MNYTLESLDVDSALQDIADLADLENAVSAEQSRHRDRMSELLEKKRAVEISVNEWIDAIFNSLPVSGEEDCAFLLGGNLYVRYWSYPNDSGAPVYEVRKVPLYQIGE